MAEAPDEHRFPCPQCGAFMQFNPAAGRLVCDHCGHEEPVAAARAANEAIPEIAFREGLESQPGPETMEVRVSHCTGCGAEIVFDPTAQATTCPYCASPVVVGTESLRQIRPHGVIPFALGDGEAREVMKRWMKGLWFAPSGLLAYAERGRALQGVYMPYWTFDAQTRSSYAGQRGTIYYEMVPVSARDSSGRMRNEMRQVARIRWMPVSGRVARFFDDVLVLASRALPPAHTEALLPWDLSQLQPYRPEYLAGFRAEIYTVPLDQGMEAARQQMNAMIERDVRFDIGGDRQQIASIDTAVSDQTFKHILLPVWSAAYRFQNKSYRLVINGQNGKVEGERPWSPVKVAAAVIAAALVIGGLIWLSQTYGQGQFG